MTENERVKELRKAKGLTLEAFGGALGVGKSTISDIENGRRSLTKQNRISICREYNVSEEWLRTGSGSMFANQSHNTKLEAELRTFFHNEPDEFREKLIRLLLRLPPEKWEVIKGFALELAAENDTPRQDSEQELAQKIAKDRETGGELSVSSGGDGSAETA